MKAYVSLMGLSSNLEWQFQVEGPCEGHTGMVNLRWVGTTSNTLVPGYTKGRRYGYIEDPDIPLGVGFRLIPDGQGADSYNRARPELVGEATTNTTGGQRMTGLVFEGVVVKTTQVAAGVRLTSSVPKSEIVLVVPPFMAKDAVNAQAMMLSAAKDAGHALDDPTDVLEAKVRQFA